jgi:glycosyltransferase involved in cell wall biosynthesis
VTPSVVHVVRSDAFAGVERYIADTATELAARGWAVTVIGGDPTAMRAQLGPSVQFAPATSVIEVARALRMLGSRDVVHAHMTAAELPAALLKNRLRARLVVTRHFATPRGHTLPGRLAARIIERKMDLQVATSRFVAAATASPSTVIYSGVRSSDAIEGRDNVVVMLQRLEAEKDTATAVRAWAEAGLGAAGWRLVIYGTGSEEQSLRTLAGELHAADTVEFAGFTDDPRAALRSAAMMLTTAVSEPFGLAVVEAMAEGTPVVATRAGAHPETLGQDGAYFAVGDPSGCAAELIRMASASAERGAIGERLRRRQRQQFSVQAHVDALERAYRGRLASAG